MTLQDAVGELDAALAENEAASFGGLYIQHLPEFRVVLLSTIGGAETLSPYVAGTPFANIAQFLEVKYTLAQLVADQATIATVAPSGVNFASNINIFENRVEVQVASSQDSQAFAAIAAQLPASTVVLEIDALPTQTADIYGGLPLSNGCTTGFNVEQTNGFQEGVSTAGHCLDATSYNGTNLPWQAGQYSGNTDAQWHTTPGFTDPNLVTDGSGTRSITARKSRTNQAVGEFICKYGRTTGFKCGTIASKTYNPGSGCVPNPTATWMLLNPPPAGQDLQEPGDSGGPVYSGNTAYGMANCQVSFSAIYMAQNYLSNIGVQVDIN